MRSVLGAAVIAAIFLSAISLKSADSLPSQLSDDAFRQIISDFSEPGGSFPYDNFLSNEASYQTVIPQLKTVAKPGGVYLGVGPEQNFTYIAALQPRIAFIIDIRRQNMLEQLLYKALFESSEDRNEFVSKLFSRRRAANVTDTSSAEGLFQAYESARPSAWRFATTLEEVFELLVREHGFSLSAEDRQGIERILRAFMNGGPQMDYGFTNPAPIAPPTYSDLMTATDGRGQNWSYLASEENFQRVRRMQRKNTIIPLVADFAGPKTLRAVGQYLTDHRSAVTAFYVSNVEQNLRMNETDWLNFRSNLAALPVDSSSTLIRFIPTSSTTLESIPDFIERDPSRKGPAQLQLLRIVPRSGQN